jgi:hypothetical protein
MPNYRFYVLDSDDHFIRALEENADDDEAAKRLVKKLAKQNAVEIWSGSRKIGRFDKKEDR